MLQILGGMALFVLLENQMKRFTRIFFALLVSIAIISLSGCTDEQVALRTSNVDKGLAAVQQLTDQSLLTRVALVAVSPDVRKAAVGKLTDQSLLAKVALEAEDSDVCEAAVRKLTDQSLLAKVALEAWDPGVREAAVEKLTDQYPLAKIATTGSHLFSSTRLAAIKKLTDQSLLAKIIVENTIQGVREAAFETLTDQSLLAKLALEDEGLDVHEAAISRLTEPAMLARLSTTNGDGRTQLIHKLILAFDNVPDEHRVRLINSILPAVRVLSDPEIVNIVGEIVSVRTIWSSRSASYWGVKAKGGNKSGELFKCSVKLKNLSESLSHTWSTFFPTSTSHLAFEFAKINAGDILGPAFERLPQSLLTKIAVKDGDSTVRIAAIEKLTDQSLLAKVAVEGKDRSVRIAAIEKLTDQSTLAKVAVEGKDQSVRRAAVNKLTDQPTLAKIVIEDKDRFVRGAARERLNALRDTEN